MRIEAGALKRLHDYPRVEWRHVFIRDHGTVAWADDVSGIFPDHREKPFADENFVGACGKCNANLLDLWGRWDRGIHGGSSNSFQSPWEIPFASIYDLLAGRLRNILLLYRDGRLDRGHREEDFGHLVRQTNATVGVWHSG